MKPCTAFTTPSFVLRKTTAEEPGLSGSTILNRLGSSDTNRELIIKQDSAGSSLQSPPDSATLPMKYQRRSTRFIKDWGTTKDTKEDYDSDLAKIIKKESTNFNFKLALNLAMIASLFLV